MRKILFVITFMAFLLPVMAEDVIYLSTEEFKARVFDYTNYGKDKVWKYKGDKPCIVDFYTTWCGPCKRLSPILEELSQEYCGQVIFYRADAERETALSYFFQITSYPSLLYIPMEGEPTIVKGLYPKDIIRDIIDEFLLKKPANDKKK